MFGVDGIPRKAHYSGQSGKDAFVVHILKCLYGWLLIYGYLKSIFYSMLFRTGLSHDLINKHERRSLQWKFKLTCNPLRKLLL